ncbi:MAG: hypothetical protein AAGB35_02445 [Pseudomonadota bacterium]
MSKKFSLTLQALLCQLSMEIRQQLRRPFVWFSLLAFFALSFGSTLEFAYGTSGNTWVNGADSVGTRALILSILGVIVAAGIVGESMSREKLYSTEEIILSTGANKLVLGFGRFAITFLIIALISSLFIPGMILASLMPGIPEERIGPHVWSHYIQAMTIYMLPNLFLVSALIYAVSARWRSQTIAFLVALALIALYTTALMMLGRDVYRHDVFQWFAMLDPYGNIAGAEHGLRQTVAQSNTEFRPLEGLLLQNRLFWISFSVLLVIVGTLSIPLQITSRQTKQKKKKRYSILSLNTDNKFLLMLYWELQTLWRHPGVLILIAFAGFSIWWTAASSITHSFSLPTTDLLTHSTGFYFDKILILLLVWYAADLIWSDRQHKVDEIIDALPTEDTRRLLAKTVALITVVLLFWSLSILINIAYQISKGFYDLELWLYFTDVFIFKAPYYIWMSILALACQIIIRQRYIAIGVVLLVYISSTLLDALGLYHPIYHYGEVSFFWYSLIDGYGHFWTGHLWFLLYWTLITLAVWTLAWACYYRGKNPPSRIYLLKQRLLRGNGRFYISVNLLAIFLVGGWILYQTTILHTWPLYDENDYFAEMEKTYREDWSKIEQPVINSIKGNIDIYPSQRRITMDGTISVKNQHQTPIDELLIFFHPLLKESNLFLDESAIRIIDTKTPEENNYVQRWRLKQPLTPDATLEINFYTAGYPDAGFAAHNQYDDVPEVHGIEILGNGTSILNLNMMPAIGYSERIEHKPTWKRKKYGLPLVWTTPESTIGDNVAHETTHLSWVHTMDLTISTDADQIPLFSGNIFNDYGIQDNRRTIRYLIDRPSRGWSELMSGRYNLFKNSRDNLPPVELYYHPPHTYTLEPMSEHLLDAMEHFTYYYGPAPFDQFRMVESSLHYNTAGARNGLAFVTEILGWKSDLNVSQGEDLRTMASNFMGMTWWADQIIPANLEGAKMVLSGLPFWSSAMYLHQSRPIELSRKLRLQDMLEAYRERAKLPDVELPFAQEMKNSVMIRKKGILTIIYLAELVGVENLQNTFASFLDNWRYQAAPYPTAQDLVNHLKNNLPENAQEPIRDLFERVTNWNLEAVKAETWQDENNQWRLKAVVDTARLYTEGIGEEKEAALNMYLPLTIFRGNDYKKENIILTEWQDLSGGIEEFEFILSEKPTRFGIDAYLYLTDSNPYNNVIEVQEIEK